MAPSSEPEAWERVLVRHVVAAKRGEIDRLSSLVRTPFPISSSATYDGSIRSPSELGYPSGRWLVAAQFARESWVPLFSNAATGRELFDANAASRRLEVAWAGCRPGGEGWFVQVHRAGEPVVEFVRGVGATDGRESAEASFRRLCVSLDIALPGRQVRAASRGFEIIGVRGKPVRSGLRGCLVVSGPEISSGDNPASDALAEAIELCDPDGIREAVGRGASLTALPDSSVSPLLLMLYKHGRCDRRHWEACLDALLAAGCPIDGPPGDDPPLVDCVRHFIAGPDARRMLEYLVSHGADVNAKNRLGETALSVAAFEGRTGLVRFLQRHGADPNLTSRLP